ncbi:hypothetical protein M0811_03639 [Anaeramoeba ignava]|uniref:Uncharacterized protein n=1 Tax=Anaeramoeba ignava TaxID=1746090 RepID=A0A9Q0L577_ANAIG|nr:hypothetical protein M0811_03639 [Anaeramoeba ignava]
MEMNSPEKLALDEKLDEMAKIFEDFDLISSRNNEINQIIPQEIISQTELLDQIDTNIFVRPKKPFMIKENYIKLFFLLLLLSILLLLLI